MFTDIVIFTGALTALIIAARFFTNAAEELGKWLSLPSFVIGIFIVGIGTSLPELISGILSVKQGVSEIVPGNIIGANVSNLLLVTGLAVAFSGRSINLGSTTGLLRIQYVDHSCRHVNDRARFSTGSTYWVLITGDGRHRTSFLSACAGQEDLRLGRPFVRIDLPAVHH